MSRAVDIMIRRIASIAEISDADIQILKGLPIEIRSFNDDQDIVREGEAPDRSFLVVEGLVGSYKLTGDGSRQIPSFYLPGDIPDLHSLYLSPMDSGFRALTPSIVGFIPHNAIHDACLRSSGVMGALWRVTLVDAAIYREWLTNIGQRVALARLAHVLCELFVRLNVVGLAEDFSYNLPLSQQELGDAIGTSTVHVNRVLQELRKQNLITYRGSRLTIINWEQLASAGDFHPAYLHMVSTEGADVG